MKPSRNINKWLYYLMSHFFPQFPVAHVPTTLNLPDITSTFHTLSIPLIVHIKYVQYKINANACLHTKLQMPTSSVH
jgi:hypothetical protein